MKRIIFAIFALIIIFPTTASAVWWKPATWNVMRKPVEISKPKTETVVATSTLTTTTELQVQSYPELSKEELLKRIAELEDKLEKSRISKKEVTTAEIVKVTQATSTVNLSEKEISNKVRSALVTLELGTSTWSGVFIDVQGHIAFPLHFVTLKDSLDAVKGVVTQINVTLTNGTKKTASVVGFNEAFDVAVFQVSSKTAVSYVKVNHDTGIKVGDKVYVFGSSPLATGTVTQKGSMIEITSSSKPADGGLVINASGAFVGLSNAPVCKVLEEMKTCLTYKTTISTARESFPRILLGMKLYKEKKNSTKEEIAVRGQLERVYMNTKDNSTFEYTINSVTGKNNFDYFNNKLGADEQGKITKLYLTKLKVAAENMGKAFDTLKGQSYTLNIFFIDEVAAVDTLDSYQHAIVKKIEVYNAAKVKEYEERVSFWSKKKNEYDGFLANPSNVTHDYLMEQGVFVEDAAMYLKSEQKKVIDTYSGEVLQLF